MKVGVGGDKIPVDLSFFVIAGVHAQTKVLERVSYVELGIQK